MKLLKTLLNENLQILSKEGVTQYGKPYKIVLLTSDSTNPTTRVKENATIGAILKITNKDKSSGYPDFKKEFGSMEPPIYQITTDKSVFGWGYFVNSESDEKEKINNLKKLKQFLDVKMDLESGAEITGGFSDLPKVSDFIAKLRDVVNDIKTSEISGTDTQVKKELITKVNEFINELADEVDNVILIEKLDEYFSWVSRFPTYSFRNQLLIYIQDRNATRVASKSAWKSNGFVPKENAPEIILWRPNLRPPSKAEKYRKREEYIKKHGRPEPGSKKEEDMEFNINKSIPIPGVFILYPVYDIRHVVDDKGNVGSDKMKPKLDWSSDIENEIADKISLAMEKIIPKLGIKLEYITSDHGEKGSSSSGLIKIDKETKGIGRASVLIHELSHEIMHQNFLINKAKSEEKDGKVSEDLKDILSAYVGKNLSEILELQAEGVAYVVLRAMDIPNNLLSHSKNYIALWRGNSSSIKGNLDIITNTANIIINKLNEVMGEVNINENEFGNINLLTINDVAKMLDAPINDDTLNEFTEAINEIKNNFKNLLVNN